MKEITAKILRIISIPPIMITSLILVLYFFAPGIFPDTASAVLSVLFLGILPVLAYPLQPIMPHFKNKGRDGQRKLAFVFTFVGYSAELIYALVSQSGKNLLLISLTYFLSVAVLTFVNKVVKVKASGHACSFTGPLIFFIHFIDWRLIFPCLLFVLAVSWSSLYLKRHTKSQLICGSCVCILSYLISVAIISFI